MLQLQMIYSDSCATLVPLCLQFSHFNSKIKAVCSDTGTFRGRMSRALPLYRIVQSLLTYLQHSSSCDKFYPEIILLSTCTEIPNCSLSEYLSAKATDEFVDNIPDSRASGLWWRRCFFVLLTYISMVFSVSLVRQGEANTLMLWPWPGRCCEMYCHALNTVSMERRGEAVFRCND